MMTPWTSCFVVKLSGRRRRCVDLCATHTIDGCCPSATKSKQSHVRARQCSNLRSWTITCQRIGVDLTRIGVDLTRIGVLTRTFVEAARDGKLLVIALRWFTQICNDRSQHATTLVTVTPQNTSRHVRRVHTCLCKQTTQNRLILGRCLRVAILSVCLAWNQTKRWWRHQNKQNKSPFQPFQTQNQRDFRYIFPYLVAGSGCLCWSSAKHFLQTIK